MAGSSQGGVQVGRRKPVIQGGPAREILSESPSAGCGRYDPSSIPPESSRPSRRRLSSGSRRDTIRFRSAQRSPRHRRPRYRGTGLSIPAYAREEFPRFPGAVAEQVTSRGVRCGNAASGYALRSVTTSHIRDQTILPRTQRTQAHPSKPLIMTINQRDHVVGLLDHEEWNLHAASARAAQVETSVVDSKLEDKAAHFIIFLN